MASSQDYYSDEEDFDLPSGRDPRLDPIQPSGPYANDDDPHYGGHWRQTPRQEPAAPQRDILYAILIGVGTAFFIGLLGLLIPSISGAAGTPLSVITILVPSVLLGLVSIVLARLKRIYVIMERTSRNMDFAQSTISELDNIRSTFQNEIAFVNQSLQMNRNFISSRLNTVKADFEGAALSSARILEGRIAEIAHNFKESVLHDTNIQANWTALLAATDKIIDLVNTTPGELDKHIQDKTSLLKTAIETQIERMTAQLELLAGNLARNQEGVQQNMLSAVDQIRDHVAVVQNAMNASVDENAEKQARKIESVLGEIRVIGNEIGAMTKSIPQQLSIDLKATEHLIEDVVEKAMGKAGARLDETISSASRSNAALAETLSALPAKLDDYMSGIAPSIAAGINENTRRSETRIIEVVKRSVIEGQAQAAQFGPTLDKIAREILDIENRLRNALDTNRQSLEQAVQKLPDALSSQIESSITGKLTSFEGGVNGKLTSVEGEIGEKLAVVEGEINRMLSTLVERQDTNAVLAKNQMAHLLDAVQAAIETVNGSVGGISGSVQDLGGKLMTVGGAIHEIRNAIATSGETMHEVQGSVYSVGNTVQDLNQSIAAIGRVIQDTNGSITSISTAIGEIMQSVQSVGGTLHDADHVVANINAVTAQFRDLIETRMDTVRQSIEASIGQFDEAVMRQRDALTQSMSGDLVTALASAQNKLAQDYQAVEERLAHSLGNFNNIVQNCISSLEETVTWRRDTFDEQIRTATEQNLVTVRREIEDLAERLKEKVAEVSLVVAAPVPERPKLSAETGSKKSAPAPVQIAEPEGEDGPDPMLIETLTKKLANIDSILGELRRENVPEFDGEEA